MFRYTRSWSKIHPNRHPQLASICARSLVHLLRRPQAQFLPCSVNISNDVSEDAWAEFFCFLIQALESGDWRKDPQGYDELIQSGLERITNTIGHYSSEFINEGSTLMQLVEGLHSCVPFVSFHTRSNQFMAPPSFCIYRKA